MVQNISGVGERVRLGSVVRRISTVPSPEEALAYSAAVQAKLPRAKVVAIF